MTLAGKQAIITGSNSGIGLGVAQELAAAGADIVLNSFTDREEDHDLAAWLGKKHGVKARYMMADMSRGQECRALIEAAGGCDILVNNAGIQHVSPARGYSRLKNGIRSSRSTSVRPFIPRPPLCRACGTAVGAA